MVFDVDKDQKEAPLKATKPAAIKVAKQADDDNKLSLETTEEDEVVKKAKKLVLNITLSNKIWSYNLKLPSKRVLII